MGERSDCTKALAAQRFKEYKRWCDDVSSEWIIHLFSSTLPQVATFVDPRTYIPEIKDFTDAHGDVHACMSLTEYVSKISAFGFVPVHKKDPEDKNTSERQLLFWESKRGILLDVYGAELNSFTPRMADARLYANYIPDTDTNIKDILLVSDATVVQEIKVSPKKKAVPVTAVSGRAGQMLLTRIQAMDYYGSFCPKWKVVPLADRTLLPEKNDLHQGLKAFYRSLPARVKTSLAILNKETRRRLSDYSAFGNEVHRHMNQDIRARETP